jgi:hypothetical protein
MTGFSVIPADTTPEAFAVYWKSLCSLSFEEKARHVVEMSDAVHALAFSNVRELHPEYDDRQVALAVLRRILGEESFRRAFPDGPPRA